MRLVVKTAATAVKLMMFITTAKFISNVVIIKGVYIVRFLFSSTFYICCIINVMVALIAVSSIVLCRKTDPQDCDFGDGQGKSLSDVGDHYRDSDSCNDLQAFANMSHIEAPEITKRVCSEEMVSNQWDCEEEEGDMMDEAWEVIVRRGSAKGREEPGKIEMWGALVSQPSISTENFIEPHDITKRAHEATIEYWHCKEEESWIEKKRSSKRKRALEKCETWSVHMPESSAGMEDQKALRKSETFNDKGSITCGEELERDPSVGLEEFNKKVQDFIDKINKELRLQRQESDEIRSGGKRATEDSGL